MPGRHESDEYAGGHGRSHGEQQDRHVDGHGDLKAFRYADRSPTRRKESPQRSSSAIRQQHAEGAPTRGQQQRLRQQLAKEPQASSPQRHTYCHLTLPRRAAGQQQARDVDAGDDQQHADRRHRPRERAPEAVAEIGGVHRDAGGCRHCLDLDFAESGILDAFRKAFQARPIQHPDFGGRLVQRDSRLESPEDRDGQRPVAQATWMLQQGLRGQRQPHRRLHTELQPEESPRRHADDPRRHAIDQERRPDSPRVEVEPPLPVRPADDRDGAFGCSHPRVLRTDQPSDRRPDAKDIEEISTHVHARHDFRGKRIV